MTDPARRAACHRAQGRPLALFIGTVGAVSVLKAVCIDKRELKCASVGDGSKVPLGFVSLTENLMMIAISVVDACQIIADRLGPLRQHVRSLPHRLARAWLTPVPLWSSQIPFTTPPIPLWAISIHQTRTESHFGVQESYLRHSRSHQSRLESHLARKNPSKATSNPN